MPSIVLLQRDHEASPHLRALIDATDTFWVAGTTHTVEEARLMLKQTQPDILVTDLKVQDGPVHDLLIELKRTPGGHGGKPNVLVTMVSQDDTLLMEALRAGADGYWIHAEAHEVLIGLLEQLSRGESPISPTIARQVLSHFRMPAKPQFDNMTEALNPLVLTGTEQAILQWVAQGYLLDEIAQQWQASAHSLACGIRRVYQKLQFDLRATTLSLQAA
jgi:DNA-binding NarL/FixJ family response regulator